MRVLLLSLAALAAAFDTSVYTDSQLVHPKYRVYWLLDGDEIQLGLDVETEGWIGFGIAEPTVGSMGGSDMVIVIVPDNGDDAVIYDRWAAGKFEPLLDDCQNWELVSAEQRGGRTMAEVRRKLEAPDPQDRPIVTGNNRIVVAFGEDDEFAYHGGANRRGSAIVFFGEPEKQPVVPEEQSVEFYMSDFLIPHDDRTTYACQAFDLPIDQDYHITSVEILVDPATVKYVHHLLVHTCTNDTQAYRQYQDPRSCESPLGDLNSGCVGLLHAWAVGAPPLILPEVAGFPMGASQGAAAHIVMEIHFDNPTFDEGQIDATGIRLNYTSRLREQDAAVMTLGDPLVQFQNIPPRLPRVHYEAECPSNCTSQWDSDIVIFADFLHMHEKGASMWSNHFRDGEYLGQILEIEYWDFNYQIAFPLNETIRRGDSINTHCIFDTSAERFETPFDTASNEEMCMEFIFYYPRQATSWNGNTYAFCGFLGPGATICGDLDFRNSGLDADNPLHPSPPELGSERQRDFGVPPDDCPNEPGTAHAVTASLFTVLLALFLV